MNRRAFLTRLAGASVPFLVDLPALAQSSKPPRIRVGAIRWDAWYDPADGKVASYVEKSLGPAEFHYRMPFFGQETGPNSVRINGDAPAVMDAEIVAAANAGIAYWALCAYKESDPMSNALKLYLSSAHRSKIDFCLISGLESNIAYFKEQTEYEIRMMREPGYMKVFGNRPLYFVLNASDEQIAHAGGAAKIAAKVDYMRSELAKSGIGPPYIVLGEWNPKRVSRIVPELKFDAVGLYATAVGPFGGAPYQELVKQTETYWDKAASSGLPVVPNIMTGWDTRPRLRNPTPWDKHPTPQKPDHYYQEGTPDEIARHVADAVAWLKAHPAEAPAQLALIYAWNECDEGFGALIPTYDSRNPQGNDARLKALARVLKNS